MSSHSDEGSRPDGIEANGSAREDDGGGSPGPSDRGVDPSVAEDAAAAAAVWLAACREAAARGDPTSEVGAREIGDPELVGVVEGLTAAIDAVLALDLTNRDGSDLLEATLAVLAQLQRLQTGGARWVSDYDRAGEWHYKAGSASARLAHRSRLPIGEHRSTLRMGRDLALMPAVDDAATDGTIGACHVRKLGRLARNRRMHQAFVRDEELLVGHARLLEWDDFVETVDYWEQHADPDGVEDNAAVDEAKRRVHLSDGLDGTGILNGQLTPVANATVSSALKHFDDEAFQRDWDDARERLGREPTVDELARTPAQRRHDALQRMAEQSMARMDGTRPAPLISFLSDFDSLAGRISKLEQTGTVVTPGTLARLIEDREVLIEQAVRDTQTQRVGLSDRRLFTGRTRRKIQLRDRKCSWPGCHEPAVRSEIDHIIEYCDGGPTTEDNGQALCKVHNRLKERIRKLNRRRQRRREQQGGELPSGGQRDGQSDRQAPASRSGGPESAVA